MISKLFTPNRYGLIAAIWLIGIAQAVLTSDPPHTPPEQVSATAAHAPDAAG